MKILITTGASGGHFLPAIVLGKEFLRLRSDVEIIFYVSERIKESPYLLSYLSDCKKVFLKEGRGKLEKLTSFLHNFFLAFREIEKETFDCVIGFGGQSSVPILLVSKWRGMPIYLHEQNAVFGLANRFLSCFATKIFLSFPIKKKKRTVVVGNLLRSDIKEYAAKKQNAMPGREKSLRVLVFGGSQGASFINGLILEYLQKYERDLKGKVEFCWITGEKEFLKYQEISKGLSVTLKVMPHTLEMFTLYQKADFLISRAGSGTIFEALAFQLPALYIPYPYAHQHQLKNAKWVESFGGCFIFEQKQERICDTLHDLILSLLKDEKILESMRKKISGHSLTNAEKKMAMTIINEYESNDRQE